MSPSRIQTPQKIFEARIEQLRKEGSGVSVRNLADRLNLSIGKDSINAMLRGDLGRRAEAYGILARGLEIDEFKVEAALAWHLMSEGARSALCDMLGRFSTKPGTIRSRLDECLRWMAPQTRVMPGSQGYTEVLTPELRFIFIYADELSVEEVAALAARPDPIDLLKRAGIAFLIVPEGWDPARKQLYEDRLPDFHTFMIADSIENAQQNGGKQIIFGTDRMVLDWIFRHRFDPATYLQNRRAKIKPGPLHAPDLAPLQVQVDGAESEPAEAALLTWCRKSSGGKTNLLTLEGAYGTGKSTILKNLERLLIETAPVTRRTPEHIPILVQARNWIRGDQASLYEWLCTQIFAVNNFGQVNFEPDMSREVFETLCAGRTRFILLVDGLDEAVRSDETLHSVMQAVCWFASLGNRVIVATRPEVFIDQAEVDRELIQRAVTRAVIMPIEPKEVDKYLATRLAGEALQLVQALRRREEVGKILERPIFLSHICELASKEPRRLSGITGDHPYDLFELLTNEWLQRERFQTSMFKEQRAVIEFLQEMAIELSARQRGRVADIEMGIAVQASLDDVTRMLRGEEAAGSFVMGEEEIREAHVCSFVTVDETDDKRHYEFNLRPFKSYFLAEAIVEELGRKEWTPRKSKIGRMRFEFDDLEFIADGLRKLPPATVTARLIEAIRFTAIAPAGRLWPYSFLGGNAAAVYAAINGNRLNLDLTGVSLAGLMLPRTKVTGRWQAIDLSEATMSDCDLRSLDAHDIYAVGAIISGISDYWHRGDHNILVPGGLISLPSGQVERGWDDVPAPDGFAWIAPGPLRCAEVEPPIGEVLMHGFYVAKTSVTNAAFRDFLILHPQWQPDAAKVIERIQRDLRDFGAQIGSEIHYLSGLAEAPDLGPVVYVPRSVMVEFCLATGNRLPSEAEWEHAFVTTGAGAENLAGPHASHPAQVDALPTAANGVAGMQRQIREMCADCYWRLEDGLKLLPTFRAVQIHPFFRPAHIDKESAQAQGLSWVSPAFGVVRGTSFATGDENPRSARERYPIGNMDKDLGFRPVVDLAPGLARVLGIESKAELHVVPAESADNSSAQSAAPGPVGVANPMEIPDAR